MEPASGVRDVVSKPADKAPSASSGFLDMYSKPPPEAGSPWMGKFSEPIAPDHHAGLAVAGVLGDDVQFRGGAPAAHPPSGYYSASKPTAKQSAPSFSSFPAFNMPTRSSSKRD